MDIKDWLPELLPQEMWKDKYRFEDETFEEWLDRVSAGNEEVRNMIKRKEFLFGGRILANRGLHNKGRKVTYSNCYVSTPPEDNIESIYEACAKLARTFSYGGGVGIDISKLRPSGAKVNNAAKTTSGAVSFMETFNHVSEVIAQNGRRGALMISMDVHHPDIEDFIDIKTNTNKITKANISVRVTDEFMKCVEEDREYECRFDVESNGEVITRKINARNLFKKLCQNNWNWAEPGILYWDRIKDYNLMQHDNTFSYAGVNPCAEEPLPAGGSCLLGSLNLSQFVRTSSLVKGPFFMFEEFKQAVRNAVIALNDVLEEGLELHPLEEQREAVEELRQIGLGVMGIAECLMKLGIRYGSQESLDMLEEIARTMSFTALDTSNDLAISRGMFDRCDPKAIIESDFFKNAISHLDELERNEFVDSVLQHGLRNSQLLTVAPTGSLATMLNISGGIEPMFAFTFTRKTESLKGKDEYFTITSPLIDEIRKEIKDGNMSEDVLVNAHMLKPLERVRVQAVWQKYTDAAISSTVNMHKDSSLEDVYEVYMEAWKNGLKGITVYRDGCKRGGVLTTKTKEDAPEVENKTEDSKIHIELSDTNVEHCAGYGAQLTTGCGTLWVTFYFHRKSGQLCHVFLDKGSTGGCNSFMVGLSRMISLAGKKGATVDEIVDQLTSTIACNSFSGRKASKKDTSKGSSCPAAIGHSLNRLHKRFLEEKSEGLIKADEDNLDSDEDKVINKCPDCGRELQMSGGCVQCVCGYSQCG